MEPKVESIYEKSIEIEPLILEPEDWSDEEWKTLCKLFGMEHAERIVVSNYTLETYGVSKHDSEHRRRVVSE